MKTLSDHIIIYDSGCPLCNLYTAAFVKTKMLGVNGRKCFNEVSATDLSSVDRKRACDEIALVNVKDNTVLYGIDSLFAILQNSYPLLRPMFRFKPFRWLMKHFYAFISYNRKVIAPEKKFEQPQSCTPSFHLGYRCAYIIFSWLVTSAILTSYSTYFSAFVPANNNWRELLICGGQMLFQAVIVSVEKPERLMHYIGNMMTISLVGAMLLSPVIVLGNMGLFVSPVTFAVWFAMVVTWMLIEHMRRVKILSLPWTITLGWVVYRVIVLAVVLFNN